MLSFLKKKIRPEKEKTLVRLVEKAEEELLPPESAELKDLEKSLIGNILHLREVSAFDVMVPRAEIIALSVNSTPEEALTLFKETHHSRLPVYEDNLDNLIGICHLHDFPFFKKEAEKENFSLREVITQPLLIAPQVSVLDLLLRMRSEHVHVALVIDEYGGIDGLITIGDLLETIVGDFVEENRDAEKSLIRLHDGTFEVDAGLLLSYFTDKTSINLKEILPKNLGVETIGGVVFTLAGRVPLKGETITLGNRVEFRVLDADSRKIKRLSLRFSQGLEEKDKKKVGNCEECL